MATLADSLLSSSARALPIRMRPDLSARAQHYLGKHYWVVKEPVGLNYFRFQDEEYAILRMLDGRISLDEIKERFEDEFPPQKITLEELQQFLGMLHRSGLVIADVGGQGRQLRKRRDERRRKEILGACSNILCIRFKGFDPERILNWLYPKLRWLFSRPVAVFCLLLWIAALTLVLVQFDVFQSKLPGFYQFFNWRNGLLLAGTLGVIKIFHEFGHGLLCKHFGGECHEIGIMILVLTPCLYCNVSDSWMLPNKWQRALIGAAGIFLEVTIASICTFVWWFTEPGLLNNLSLNAMFVASVSTILFNGNPLLRYDGYYVLADVAEIPNLRQKATTILSRKMAHLCLGMEPPDDPFLPQRNQTFFALYSIAAAMYRWFILASIMYFLFQVFKPYGLEIIGEAIVMMSIYGLVVVPLYKVGKFFYVPGRLEKVKKPHMYTTLGVLAALILAVVFVPLPYSVMCPLEIQARHAERVYVAVTEGGRLESIDVEPGQRVYAHYTEQFEQQAKRIMPELYQAGSRRLDETFLSKLQQTLIRLQIDEPMARATVQTIRNRYGQAGAVPMPILLETVQKSLAQPLAQLGNVDVDMEVARLAGEEKQLERQWEGLDRQRHDDLKAGAQLPAVEEALEAVRNQLAQRLLDQARLRLVAPQTGIVLPSDSIPERETVEGQLPGWSGTPLQKKNLGCHLDKGVEFCKVGDPKQLEAILVIDQTDVELVREIFDEQKRPKADIKLDELPQDVLLSEVLEVSEAEMKVVPRRLAAKAGGDVPTTTDPNTGRERPQSTSYRAVVPLGLYGHGDDYEWLRGRLEYSPDSDSWKLRYLPQDGMLDRFGGVVTLPDPSLLGGYDHGDFVELKGNLPEGTLDESATPAGNPSPKAPAYEITESRALDEANGLLRVGLRGRAKVHTRWMPLWTRFWRFIRHTFKFKL